MMDEPRFAQPIPNVTVAVGRDANLPCVVEHLGAYKVSIIHAITTYCIVHNECCMQSVFSTKTTQLLMNKTENNALRKEPNLLSQNQRVGQS